MASLRLRGLALAARQSAFAQNSALASLPCLSFRFESSAAAAAQGSSPQQSTFSFDKLPSNLKIDGSTAFLLRQVEKEEAVAQEADPLSRPLSLEERTVEVKDFTTAGGLGEKLALDNGVFGSEVRKDILHRVVVWQEKNSRTTLYKTKTRAEVSGGGRKPWRQKGTGRARQGSIRSPIWKGGGVAHGPVFRDWSIDLPKKIRAMGLRCALSAKLRDRRLIVVQDFALTAAAGAAAEAGAGAAGRAKTLREVLKQHDINPDEQRVVLVTGEEVPAPLQAAISNMSKAKALPAIGANVRDILNAKTLILSKEAVELLTLRLS